MMKKVYGDDCWSRSRIHEWFKGFQEGREALEHDERSGRPRNVVNEENAEIVREFIRKEPKSRLKYMESELSAASIYRILTENMGYINVCAINVCSLLWCKRYSVGLTIIVGSSKSVPVYALHSLENVLCLARFRVFVPNMYVYMYICMYTNVLTFSRNSTQMH